MKNRSIQFEILRNGTVIAESLVHEFIKTGKGLSEDLIKDQLRYSGDLTDGLTRSKARESYAHISSILLNYILNRRGVIGESATDYCHHCRRMIRNLTEELIDKDVNL